MCVFLLMQQKAHSPVMRLRTSFFLCAIKVEKVLVTMQARVASLTLYPQDTERKVHFMKGFIFYCSI